MTFEGIILDLVVEGVLAADTKTEGSPRRRPLVRRDLVGVYLHSSAVLIGLRPHSDIDVIVVSMRRTSLDKKRSLLDLLLALSGWGRSIRRPIELDVVVQSEIQPCRYPPAFDFHFNELWRKQFGSGKLQPWPTLTNRDLASAITMTLVGDTALFGPPPATRFPGRPSPQVRAYADFVVSEIERRAQS